MGGQNDEEFKFTAFFLEWNRKLFKKNKNNRNFCNFEEMSLAEPPPVAEVGQFGFLAADTTPGDPQFSFNLDFDKLKIIEYRIGGESILLMSIINYTVTLH